MDVSCDPRASPKNIHSSGRKKCLKPELFAADITGAAHFAGSHRLSNRAFHPGSFGVARSKLRSQFTRAGLMK